VEGLLVVDLDATGEQHVHLAAAQGAQQGGGVAEGHQVDTAVGGAGSPVLLERGEPLLLAVEESEAIGPGAHEAVVEGFVGVGSVGGGGDGGEEDGREQAAQGAEGGLELQFDLMAAGGAHRLHAVAELVAEGADRHEALQREHHGGRIKRAAVVELHAFAQRDAGPQPIGAQHRWPAGQPRLDRPIGGDRIKGIPQGAEHLHLAGARGLGGIEGIDAGLAGHDQGAGGMGRGAGGGGEGQQGGQEARLLAERRRWQAARPPRCSSAASETGNQTHRRYCR
jgi:hypothetical protein